MEFIRPMGGKWTRAFMKRFPQLKTKLSKAIEAARVMDVPQEQVLNFNDEFRQVFHEKKIQLKNIYNSDETGNHSTPIGLTVGSSIGTFNGINVVVDIELNKQYIAQPGRQEWVTVIECRSAAGTSIPPYVIFKGQNLVSSWVPLPPPPGWTFTTNATGWTNNFHGTQWIQHFNNHTKPLLDSPDDYRLLLCDGHDSHISAAVAAYCLQNRIVLMLLPPHFSYLLQPLNVGIFSPLKMALAQRQTHLFRSGLQTIQKVKWADHYIQARS